MSVVLKDEVSGFTEYPHGLQLLNAFHLVSFVLCFVLCMFSVWNLALKVGQDCYSLSGENCFTLDFTSHRKVRGPAIPLLWVSGLIFFLLFVFFV